MSQDSLKVFFIGVVCGALFAIPLSIFGGAAVFVFLDGIRSDLEAPAVASPVPPRASSFGRETEERPRSVERPAGPSRKDPLSDRRPQRRYPDRGRGRFLDQPAPTFVATTLGGDPWRLADHRGKVVVLDFWASWCKPCIQQIPELREIDRRFRRRSDFAMVGISLDRQRRDLEECIARHRVEWPQLFEEGRAWNNSVAELYGVRAIPHVVVIDRQGIVRAFPRGADLEAHLVRLLDSETAEVASSGTSDL